MAITWPRARDVDVALCAAVTRNDAPSVATLLRTGASPTAVVSGACILSHVTDPDVAHVLARMGASMSILLCLDNITTSPQLLRAVLTDAPPRIVTHLRVPSFCTSAAGFNGVQARFGGAVTVLLRLVQHVVAATGGGAIPHGSSARFTHHVAICARMLVATGVPVDARDAAGRNAVSLAAAAGHHVALLCAVLVAAGAELRSRDGSGETALSRMAANVQPPAARPASAAVVAESIYNGARLAAWSRRSAALAGRAATLRGLRKRARRA